MNEILNTLIDIKGDIKSAIEQYTEVDCGMIGYADKIRNISNYPAEINVPINTKFCGSTFERIPQFDTSNWTTLSSLFYDCENLKEAPVLDFKTAKSMSSLFAFCYSLKKINGLINVDNITYIEGAFYNCHSLESIPEIDVSKVRSFTKVITGCTSLVECGGFKGLGNGMLDIYNDIINLDISETKLSDESIINVISKLGSFPADFIPITPSTYGSGNGLIILTPQQYSKIPNDIIAETEKKRWKFY